MNIEHKGTSSSSCTENQQVPIVKLIIANSSANTRIKFNRSTRSEAESNALETFVSIPFAVDDSWLTRNK